ncbi:transposase family protein [Streptomyces sp. NPDC001108]
MSHHAFCGLSRKHLGALVEELAPRWEARCESARHQRREGARQRQAGAGPKQEFVFTDRLPATLVHLRTGPAHEALGVLYEVESSTIGRALAEIRPLLAERGFAVPDRPGVRLRALADVFSYAEAEDVTLRIDGMETPGPPPPGRPAWPPRLRLRQAQAEHLQDHHDQRPPGPHPVVRRPAARPHA